MDSTRVHAVPKVGRKKKPRSICLRCKKPFTAKALLRHAKGCGKPNRFGSVAKKTFVGEECFPSRLEAETYLMLSRLVEKGFYLDLIRYPSVLIIPDMRWKVDFRVTMNDGSFEWIEAKGVETGEYKLKLATWRTFGPGPISIYKADRNGMPVLAEPKIIPKICRLLFEGLLG